MGGFECVEIAGPGVFEEWLLSVWESVKGEESPGIWDMDRRWEGELLWVDKGQHPGLEVGRASGRGRPETVFRAFA